MKSGGVLKEKAEKYHRNQVAEFTAADLRDARARLGWSQRELADVLRTPLSTYEGWERGPGRVPGVVGAAVYYLERYEPVCAELLQLKQRERIEQDWPDGIPSVQEEEGADE